MNGIAKQIPQKKPTKGTRSELHNKHFTDLL